MSESLSDVAEVRGSFSRDWGTGSSIVRELADHRARRVRVDVAAWGIAILGKATRGVTAELVHAKVEGSGRFGGGGDSLHGGRVVGFLAIRVVRIRVIDIYGGDVIFVVGILFRVRVWQHLVWRRCSGELEVGSDSVCDGCDG